MTIHEQYHELAEQSLQKSRIDPEAYIVKVLSEMVMSEKESVTNNDRVPESQIDEQIETMEDKFVIYMQNKTEENLLIFLNTAKRILSEVYHDCDTFEKRELCKKTFDNIACIC